VIGKIDKGGRADRDEDVGAQARAALPVLALGPYQGAEHERDQQADQRVEKIIKLKGLDELHGAHLGRAAACNAK
jgi:hypothetical protein